MRQVSVEMGLSDPLILRDWLRIYNKRESLELRTHIVKIIIYYMKID